MLSQRDTAYPERSDGTLFHGLRGTKHGACLKLRATAVVGSRGNAHAAQFIEVILPVEDVPLLAAFENFFFLRSDPLAHFQFDLLFFFQRGGQNLHHLLANRVAVINKFYFFALDKHVSDLMREAYAFFAGQAHRSWKSSYKFEIGCAKRLMQVRHRPKPSLLPAKKRLAQDQLAVPGQLLLHLLVHLLIRNAGPPHFVLMIDQDLPHLLV